MYVYVECELILTVTDTVDNPSVVSVVEAD